MFGHDTLWPRLKCHLVVTFFPKLFRVFGEKLQLDTAEQGKNFFLSKTDDNILFCLLSLVNDLLNFFS